VFPTRGRGLFVCFVWYFRDDAIVATGTAVRASNCWSARARMSQSVVRSAQPVSLASGACSGTCRVCCSGRRRQIVTLSLRVLFSGHGQHAEYTVLHNLSLFGASEHYKGQLLACVKGWGGRRSHETSGCAATSALRRTRQHQVAETATQIGHLRR